MMDEEEREAEIKRAAEELEDEHDQRAERLTNEIMAKLDLDRINAGINKTVVPTSLEAAYNVKYSKPHPDTVVHTLPYQGGLSVRQPKPDYNIIFHNTAEEPDGRLKQVQIGKIDFNGGVMKFEGNAEQSAMVFMDTLASTFTGRLKAEHVAAAKLLMEFVTFELSEEMEIDDAYRKGFNDAIYAVRGVLTKKIKEMENKP